MFVRRLALLAVAAASFVAAIPANAQSVSVSFHRYELNSEAGMTSVMERVRRSVASACAGDASLSSVRASKSCRTALGRQIIDQIGNPALTARWTGAKGDQVAAR